MKTVAVVIILIIIVIVFTHLAHRSQPEKFSIDQDFSLRNIRGLAFSGAGTLGYVMIGALEEMIRSGLDVRKVDYFAGTSAGSFISAFLACRIPIQDIKEYIMNLNVKELFIEQKNSVSDRLKRKSVFNGSILEEKSEEFLSRMTGVQGITFQQIYEKYGTTVICATVNVKSPRTPIYLSRFNYPNMSIATATRASSSIPFVFDPVYYDGMTLVDGGCLDIFPIKELQKYVPLSQITGVCLDSDLKYLDESWKKIPHYTGLTSKMVRRRFHRNRLTTEEKQRVVFISFHNKGLEYSAINFNMSEEIKNIIYNMGITSTRNFLHGSEFHI